MRTIVGPRVIRVRGPASVLEAALGAGAIDQPTLGAAVPYDWPRDVVLESMFLGAASGVAVDDAGLELGIFDDDDQPIITDSFRPEFASARALVGARRRWLPLGIPVRAGARWRFQFQNVGPNTVRPRLYFRVRELAARGR